MLPNRYYREVLHWPRAVFSRRLFLSTVASSAKEPSSHDPAKVLQAIHEHGSRYGFHTKYFAKLPRQKVIVEFSSPNIAKLFHIGHYRSTVIGNALSNIHAAAGHQVYKMNYPGDWGLQFALLALGFKLYGDNDVLRSDPLTHLYSVYVAVSKEADENPDLRRQARQLFMDMENGAAAEALAFWKTCLDLSMDEFRKMYSRIGVSFDEYAGESRYVEKGKGVLQELEALGLLETGENGARFVNLEGTSRFVDDGGGGVPHEVKPILARQNGTSLYLTRDVAAAVDRYARVGFDRMIYVTDSSQELHFRQLFSVLELMGHRWAHASEARLVHVGFGKVRNMSTRRGNVVFLQETLDDACKRVAEDRYQHDTRRQDIEDLDHVIETLALTGLVCQDLKASLRKGYAFSWDAVIASKGHHGLLLQYTHCRLSNLEKLCGVTLDPDVTCDVTSLHETPDAIRLVRHLDDYADVTRRTYETLEPSVLLRYLYQLCHLVAKAHRTCVVKGAEPERAQARLLCFRCARTVLGSGMRVLGVTPLKKM